MCPVARHRLTLKSLSLLNMHSAFDPSWANLQTLLSIPGLPLQSLHLGETGRSTIGGSRPMLHYIALPQQMKQTLRRLSLSTDPAPWLSYPQLLPPHITELDLADAPPFNPTALVARLCDGSLTSLHVLWYRFVLVYSAWCTPGRKLHEAQLWSFDGSPVTFAAEDVRQDVITQCEKRGLELLPRSHWTSRRSAALSMV